MAERVGFENTSKRRSCDQWDSLEAHTGGGAVCSADSSLGLSQDSHDSEIYGAATMG
jgi:hypothetical protein